MNNTGLDKDEENKEISIDKITGQETENTLVQDRNGNKITIPAGFKVINPNQTIEEGIVIEDVSANNSNTIGNQFVWIPCTLDGSNNTLKYDRYAYVRDGWEYRQIKLSEKDADGSYKIQRADNTSYYFHEEIPEKEGQSIEKYGGYYIGRYEVGCDTLRTSDSSGNITNTAKIKSGLNLYNWITRDEAATIAEKIYTGKSKLCSSYAWNTALQFIGGTYVVNSEGENYSGGLKNTGYYSIKNIYVMGGNAYEWTTENASSIESPSAFRGGSYFHNALVAPAASRHRYYTSYHDEYLGMRVTLYM